MTDLREKIAAKIEPLLDGSRGTSDADYEAEQRALEIADRILTIPELRAAISIYEARQRERGPNDPVPMNLGH